MTTEQQDYLDDEARANALEAAASFEVLEYDSSRPASDISPKVSGGVAAGAIATLVVFISGQYGLTIPPGVEGAIATLIGFAAGYLIPDNR